MMDSTRFHPIIIIIFLLFIFFFFRTSCALRWGMMHDWYTCTSIIMEVEQRKQPSCSILSFFSPQRPSGSQAASQHAEHETSADAHDDQNNQQQVNIPAKRSRMSKKSDGVNTVKLSTVQSWRRKSDMSWIQYDCQGCHTLKTIYTDYKVCGLFVTLLIFALFLTQWRLPLVHQKLPLVLG